MKIKLALFALLTAAVWHYVTSSPGLPTPHAGGPQTDAVRESPKPGAASPKNSADHSPGATALTEICNNGIDDNCDGLADYEDVVNCPADFFIPEDICRGTTLTITGAPPANSYYWSFYEQSPFESAPVISTLGMVSGGVEGQAMVKDGGNYYGFTFPRNSSSGIIRWNFGNSLANTPTQTTVNVPGIPPGPGLGNGVRIVKAGDFWYGFWAYHNRIYRLNFGNSITNIPPSTLIFTGTNHLDDIDIIYSCGNWYGFCAEPVTGLIRRLDFGPNLNNNSPGVTLILNDANRRPQNIEVVNVAGNWHLFFANWDSDVSLVRLDLGPNLANNSPTPVGLNISGLGELDGMTVFQDCGKTYILAGSYNTGNLYRLEFTPDITSVPTLTHFGNLGFPEPGDFSELMRFGDAWYTLLGSSNANSGVIRLLKFEPGTSPAAPSSTLQNPTLTFNTPGTYTARLYLNENFGSEYGDGIRGQRVICKTFTVGHEVTDTTAQTICANELPYAWNGLVFTEAGSQTVTLSSPTCDTLATLNLSVIPTTSSVETHTACNTYIWNGQTLTQSGAYVETFTNTASCDSTVTLNLTINQSNSGSATASACESYTWNGQTLTQSGNYTTTLTNAVGCDSIVTLELTILEASHDTLSVTACNFYTWNGQTLTQSGFYSNALTNTAGCDSVITLQLTIPPIYSDTITVAICEGSSYSFQGSSYSSSGTYSAAYSTVEGCDSTITLLLTVNPIPHDTVAATVCQGDVYTLPGGGTVTAAGVYSDTLTAANGCDSIVTTVLTVLPYSSYNLLIDETICEGQTYLLPDGTPVSAAGVYTATFSTVQGCDSTITTRLLIDNEPCRTRYKVFVPNAFSPNDDGINDTWQVFGNKDFMERLEVQVFDRWGEKVFESDDIHFQWNGHFKGKPVSSDVYVYVVKVFWIDGNASNLYTGDVTVVR